MDLPTEEETFEFFTRVWEKTEDKDVVGKESETSAAAAAAAAGDGDGGAGAEDATEEERQRQEVQFNICISSLITMII